MRPRRTAAAAVLVLLLTGCASGDGETSPSATTAPSTTASSPASPSATSPSPTGTSPLAAPATAVAGVKVVATGLEVPWGLARLDDGSYLVSLRDQARIVHVATNGTVTRVNGRQGRSGRSWFSYDVPVEESRPMVLVVMESFSARFVGACGIIR